MSAFYLLTILIISTWLSFILAVPIIDLLYRFRVTRQGDSDFSNLIEKRKLKIGVPVMGGLIFVIPLVIVNILLNLTPDIGLILVLVCLSAVLGGIDDLLNIFGYKRRVRALRKVHTLIRVHSSKLVRLKLVLLYPWYLYSRFFFMLGSNPGKGIQAHEKIIVQVIVGAALAYWLQFQNPLAAQIPFPFLGAVNLGILFVPFVILAVVLMTNAVNIADGLDGLSTSQILPSLIAFGVISLDKGEWDITLLLTITVGALLAYLYFNIPPARVQMGDVGSLALGAILSCVAFILNEPLLLLVISLPFALTLGSTVIQGLSRRILGKRVLLMAPLHHHFELQGWSEEKVVMRFALFSILCSIVGLWIYFADKVL